MSDTLGYLRALYGDHTGRAHIGIGAGPYRDGSGKYKHRDWRTGNYAWPDHAEDLAERIARESAAGRDVYSCVSLMRGDKRTPAEAAARTVIHADVDGTLDLAEVARLGGFAVGSGTSGHGHAYIPLTEDVSEDVRKSLILGLRARLGGDNKLAANDVLRPPGTLNYKPTTQGRPPAPVVWLLRPSGDRVAPEDLAERLGVSLDSLDAQNGAQRPEQHMLNQGTAPVDLAGLPSWLTDKLAVVTNRSDDTQRIVGGCHDYGLTLDQTRQVVDLRPDLAERARAMLARSTPRDDVAECYRKAERNAAARPQVSNLRDLHLSAAPLAANTTQDAQNGTQDAPEADPGTTGDPQPAQEPPARAWRPVDLTAYLDGTHKAPEPLFMPRTDGLGLLYAGLTHSLHGESESGKSLVAQAEAARLLTEGGRVLFVDFESDPQSVIERLRMLGADRAAIAERFTYLCPDVDPRSSAAEAAAWLDVLRGTYELAIIDGVTASLGVFGGATKDNDNITAWTRLLPDGIAKRTGAAVVSIDHVTKDPETRGRFAIGGQAKMAALTGAAYVVEVAEPLGRGLRGVVVLRIAKDRPGYIRARAGDFRARDRTQEVARVVVDSTGPGTVVTVEPPHDAAAGGAFRPTALMERASMHLEAAGAPLTLNAWRDGFSGKREAKREAIAQLVAEGFVTLTDGPNRSKLHTLARPYRQAEDPASDRFVSTHSPGTHPTASSGAFSGGEWVPALQAGTQGPTHSVGPGPTWDPPGPTGPTAQQSPTPTHPGPTPGEGAGGVVAKPLDLFGGQSTGRTCADCSAPVAAGMVRCGPCKLALMSGARA